MSAHQVKSEISIPIAAGFRKTFALLLALVLASASAVAAEPSPSSTTTLESVAKLVLDPNSEDVGELFNAVRLANPSKGAIKTLRELNKAMDEGRVKVGAVDKELTKERLTAVQKRIKAGIMEARIEAYKRFAKEHPREARTLYAIGDVGSWRGDDNINSDVDYTVFGTDKEVARLFVEQYLNPMTLERIAGPRLGTFAQKLKYGRVVVLDIKEDFDVVVTPEGSEAEAKVFETREARTYPLPHDVQGKNSFWPSGAALK